MDQDPVVRTVELRDGGTTYKASYYIEDGTLHADLAGRRQSTVCMGIPAEVLVTVLLAERVMELTAKPAQRQRQGTVMPYSLGGPTGRTSIGGGKSSGGGVTSGSRGSG